MGGHIDCTPREAVLPPPTASLRQRSGQSASFHLAFSCARQPCTQLWQRHAWERPHFMPTAARRAGLLRKQVPEKPVHSPGWAQDSTPQPLCVPKRRAQSLSCK